MLGYAALQPFSVAKLYRQTLMIDQDRITENNGCLAAPASDWNTCKHNYINPFTTDPIKALHFSIPV